MKNSPYERVHLLKKPVKRMYRRYKNKLTKDELAGYEAFKMLVALVEKNERFLVDKDCFEKFSKTLYANKERESDHSRDDVTDSEPSLLKNLDSMNFNACVAAEVERERREKLDVFACFEFMEDNERDEGILFFHIFHEEVQNIKNKEDFKTFLVSFYGNHFALVPRSKHDGRTNLYCNLVNKRDPNSWMQASYWMAQTLSTIILHKQEEQATVPLSRMGNCIFARAANGTYEARNHYTYVCEQSKAPRYRRLVNEKHRAHGHTGHEGTKAFHYNCSHWRYYKNLGRHVFVQGYFAGRQKPKVQVIQ